MSVRRSGQTSNTDRVDGDRRLFARRPAGTPPVRKAVRNAKLVSLPVAYAGRHAVGVGRRALGRPADEVSLDIRVRTAQHIFEVLGELKGCAAKLGQLLSIYELALPPELAEPYRTALAQLQDSTPTMLPQTVEQAMAAALGDGWRASFREFDTHRPTAASIGQVHRAVWCDGRPAAVKVMFPGARESVLSDLEQLRRISVLATVFVPGADVKSVTEAICACVADELDYAAEADNQRVFAEAYAGDPDFLVPRVIAQHGDVVVGEWLDGTPVSRIIAGGTTEQRNRAGLLIVRFLLSSWRRTGLLYADPHPGNFRMMPDGRLGIVDFGACTPWPNDGFDQLVQDVTGAVINGGTDELEAAFRRHGFVQPHRGFDVAAAHRALSAAFEPMVRPTFRLTTDWLRTQVRRALNPQLSNVNRELTIPPEFTPFGRATLTALGAVCQLGTDGSLRDEFVEGSPPIAAEIARFDPHRLRPRGASGTRPRFSVVD
ncbi:AarF/ABC1/UbiB kinase family protein [Nocardia sp. BMG51109]|uniref:ABC1 kinase family protein n=1 Tax=Nocardia sp. BMG51109 TaxID=1056816 RepID=UPI0004648786|nr:AarF/ABC1/UbiB kinase family protein [Nocardia sp. BMG51109]